MPLEYSKAPAPLQRELEELAAKVSEFKQAFSKLNFVPKTFPQDELFQQLETLANLQHGTAEGCRLPLQIRQESLPKLRRTHILFNDKAGENDLTRDGGVDKLIKDIESQIGNALAAYRDQPFSEKASNEPADAFVAFKPEHQASQVHQSASRLSQDLKETLEILCDDAPPELLAQKAFDTVKRQNNDAFNQSRLIAEITFEKNVAPSWLAKIGQQLKKMPALMRLAAKGVKIAVEFGLKLHTIWHDYSHKIIHAAAEAMNKLADETIKLSYKLEGKEELQPVQELPFNLAEVRKMLNQGIAPPKEWVKHITVMNGLYRSLTSLEAFKELIYLQELDLSGAQVSNLQPLAGLTQLQSVDLNFTQVSDLSPLANLNQLQSLNLGDTKVSDLSLLANLKQLQSLNLRDTKVSDLSPLAKLTQLQSLDLGNTKVLDLSPLAKLTQLRSLYLSNTQVSDLSPLNSQKQELDIYISETETRNKLAKTLSRSHKNQKRIITLLKQP